MRALRPALRQRTRALAAPGRGRLAVLSYRPAGALERRARPPDARVVDPGLPASVRKVVRKRVRTRTVFCPHASLPLFPRRSPSFARDPASRSRPGSCTGLALFCAPHSRPVSYDCRLRLEPGAGTAVRDPPSPPPLRTSAPASSCPILRGPHFEVPPSFSIPSRRPLRMLSRRPADPRVALLTLVPSLRLVELFVPTLVAPLSTSSGSRRLVARPPAVSLLLPASFFPSTPPVGGSSSPLFVALLFRARSWRLVVRRFASAPLLGTVLRSLSVRWSGRSPTGHFMARGSSCGHRARLGPQDHTGPAGTRSVWSAGTRSCGPQDYFMVRIQVHFPRPATPDPRLVLRTTSKPSRREKYWVSDPDLGVAHPLIVSSLWVPNGGPRTTVVSGPAWSCGPPPRPDVKLLAVRGFPASAIGSPPWDPWDPTPRPADPGSVRRSVFGSCTEGPPIFGILRPALDFVVLSGPL